MSIETEFESTITNVKNAYQGLDNLGATIPENKTIENIKSCLDEIYAKFPKTSYAEGSNITLSNTLKGKLDFEDGIVGIGDTYQYSTQGINLFYINKADDSRTWNGVTIKSTKTGFSATGQASASGGYILIDRYVTLQAGTYRLRLKKPTTLTKVGLAKTDYSEIVSIEKNSSLSSSFTLAEETNVCLRIVITNGETYNEENELMIYSGTAEKDFEPYTNGASPNPSYPQDIEVVRGKNRCDGKFRQGGWGGTGSARLFTTQNYPIKKGEEFTLSTNLNTTIYKYGIQIGSSPYPQSSITAIIYDSGWITTKPFTFIASASGYLGITVAKANGTDDITVDDISDVTWQLENGSQATSYLPYNTLEVVERSLNKLPSAQASSNEVNSLTFISNGKGTYTLNGTASATSYYDYSIEDYVIQDGDYLYLKNTETNGNISVALLNGTTQIMYTGPSSINRIVSLSSYAGSTIDTLRIRTTAQSLTNFVLKPMISDTASLTEFIEYYKATYQLSLGEYEFAKIGNYVDTIEYDVDNDKVYKNEKIGKARLTGTAQTWASGVTSINEKKRYYTDGFMNVIVKPSSVSVIGNVLCNYYKPQVASSQGSYGGKQGISVDAGGRIYINDDNYQDNLDGWKTWLDSVECYIYYALETPIKTEITGTLKDQIKAFYNSHSFTGTTIIEIDGQLPLIIKVRALKGN